MSYVVDASVLAKWFFPEDYSEDATRLRESNESLFAPSLLLLETASIVSKKARLGDITSETAEDIIALVKLAPIQLQPWTGYYDRAFERSIELHKSVYDCLYLALAETLDCRFVTADRRFIAELPDHIRNEYCLWVQDIP